MSKSKANLDTSLDHKLNNYIQMSMPILDVNIGSYNYYRIWKEGISSQKNHIYEMMLFKTVTVYLALAFV